MNTGQWYTLILIHVQWYPFLRRVRNLIAGIEKEGPYQQLGSSYVWVFVKWDQNQWMDNISVFVSCWKSSLFLSLYVTGSVTAASATTWRGWRLPARMGRAPLPAAPPRKVRGMLGRASRHTSSTLSSSVTCAGDTGTVLLLRHGRARATLKGLRGPTFLSHAVFPRRL